jgi:hypothetical protein
MIHDRMAGTVETMRERALGHRHAHGVCRALAERTGRGFDPRRQQRLGMTGRTALPLPETIGDRRALDRSR